MDPVGYNSRQLEWYKKLIQLRRNHPALHDGKFEFLKAEGHLLAYSRSNGSEEIIVIFNTSDTRQKVPLGRTGNYMELLTNRTTDIGSLFLNPLSAMVLKKL